MSSDGETVIRVDGVSKCFEIYDRPRDQLKQLVLPRLQRWMGRTPGQYYRDFWALRDISLEIRRGESCGIVGLNGSGKSTLLQIITGTLHPTAGTVAVQGRVAALLELGSGFNAEFSGRENVFMSGALLGYSRAQVEARMDDIQAFADIGDHFDRPLNSYSSGMQMRVAFAVTTAFDPDILIVDEALAVGDAFFQQRCFHRLEQFREGGGTLLFVSHDANTVKHLCNRAVLISHGRAISQADPRTVIDLYQGLIARKSDLGERELSIRQTSASATWTQATTVTTNDDAELVDFQLLGPDREPLNFVESESTLTVSYRVRMCKDFDRPAFGLIVRDRLGRSLYETSTYAMRLADRPVAAGAVVQVDFTFKFNVRAGQYSFSIGVANRGYGRSEFEEYSLLMHDVQQVQVTEAVDADRYGGIFNLHPVVSVTVSDTPAL